MRNYELGRDDWEMGGDRGMDFIDDPDVPTTTTTTKKVSRTNYCLIKKDGTKILGLQGVKSDVDYVVTPQGTALFLGDELKEHGLDPKVAKLPHTELPAAFIAIALREGDNRGNIVENIEKAHQAREAKRAAEHAAEEAKLTLEERVLRSLDDLHYDPQLTGEFGETAGIMKPSHLFWELWKQHKQEIKELGFTVDYADDFEFYYVSVPKKHLKG